MKERERPQTRFNRACRGLPVDQVPVWMMRQAGRYMPEYQALKKKADFITICRDPDLAAKATLDAVHLREPDAAIIFSDITIPAHAMGQRLSFSPGPKLDPPVRTMEDVLARRPVDAVRDMGYVMEACHKVRAELPDELSLIGFIGAPLTLAGYMIEGTPSRSWRELKRMVYGEPKVVHALLERVTETLTAHAAAQIDAGCDAVQLFDSTAGELMPAELRAFAFRYAREVIQALRRHDVPVIYFARGIGAHLEGAADLGADVLGIDWTVSISEARRRLGDRIALMGNLDPAVLFTTPEEVDRRVHQIIREANGLDGFIFNLGHGVLPETPVPNARQVILSVRTHGRRTGAESTP
ncbi:MAG: uroporphyrinogen decarboxylase [Myxococcota bacterium]